MMRRGGVLAVALVATACEFGEITVPEGEPLVIVQAIMRPDLARQWVLVEQTLSGSMVIDSNSIQIPGDAPQLPLIGATVTVTNRSDPADPCGVTTFTENPGVPDIPVAAGVYWSPVGCPTMAAGDTLELLVTTSDGRVVSGVSEVPGVRSFLMRVASDSVVVPGPMLELNRDVDTLKVSAAVLAGRTLQLEVRRPDVLGVSVPGFWFVVDSTAITVPGDLPDIISVFFSDTVSGIPDEFPPVFAAGRYYSVTVALGDDRYFDFVRSGNIPPSGRGFVNNLEGGLGVFGSLVAATNQVRIVGNVDDDREGRYQLSGTLLGVPVDAQLELYVATAEADSTGLSSFVTGQWLHGLIDESADGTFRGDTLELVIVQRESAVSDSVSAYLLVGPTSSSAATTLTVYDSELRVVGGLAVERVGT
ncbi:MAG: hypothetical protein OER90_16595 [Gemmatimonadota bacterium]|nr:hypothetical protein [Gemmatimonadota bacterium]